MLFFEKPDYYARRRIRDRFDTKILKQYLEALGIDAFNPNFYLNEGHLVEKVGPSAPAMQLFDLAV
ncbi:MAG: hypothetical protein B7Y97_11365 [Sphingomonas sp. 32-66-10]|nr:MAG: hypothetical protein B7Y97_11365 [Sphingomonas sp. 32-66-10]